MFKTKKIRFLVSRGNPLDGAIIRAGAVIDFPVFWADRFIADGTAVLVEEDKKESTDTKKKKK